MNDNHVYVKQNGTNNDVFVDGVYLLTTFVDWDPDGKVAYQMAQDQIHKGRV